MADNHIKFPTPEGGDMLAPEVKPANAKDVFPDLGNEKLIDAMNALKKEENQQTQTAFIEQVIGARFFAPVDVLDANGDMIQGTGKMAIPKDAKFNFKLIENKAGEQYFTVFTDVGEFMKWSKSNMIKTIVVVFPQIAQLAQQKADDIKGFVINPMSQNIIFTQEIISNLLTAMKSVAEQQKERREAAAKQQQEPVKLMFGKAQNIPDAVYGSFRKKLVKTPEVKEAYFCQLMQGEQEFYLFALDIDAQPEECKKIANSLCETAKLFLSKFPIIAAPLNSPYGEGAKKVGEPFYVKETE